MNLAKYPSWLKSLLVAAAFAVGSPGPQGLALAAVLLFGYPMVAAAIVGMSLNWILRGFPLGISVAGGFLRAGEVVLLAWLLRRLPWFDLRFRRPRGVIAYATVTLGISAATGFALAAALVALRPLTNDSVVRIWDVYWSGDVAAYLIYVPLVLILASSEWRYRRAAELAELIAVIVAAAALAYWGLPRVAEGSPLHPASILLVALLFWLAVRFRQQGAMLGSLAVLVASILHFSGTRFLLQLRITNDILDRTVVIGIISLASLALAAGLSELTQSEQTFLEAFENSPDGMTIATLDGSRLIAANRRFLEFTGLRREEAIGRPIEQLGVWMDPGQRESIVRTVLERGFVREVEVPTHDPKGQPRTALIAAALVHLDEEPCLLTTMRDVTERKKTESALRQSKQESALLSLAFQQSPAPMSITRVRDSRFMEVNDSFVAFYGAPREEIVGRSSLELNIWVDLKQREYVLQHMGDAGGLHDYEVALRTRSGTVRTVLWSGDIVQAESEQWMHVTLNDITFEKAAQKALQDSEVKYRELFENANDFLFTLDFGGTFLSINRKGETLCGVTAVEAMSRKFEDMMQPASRDAFVDHFARVVQGGEPEVFEITLQSEQLAAPVLEVALRLVRMDGRAVAVQGIGRDVSERRLLEKKFLQAQKMEAIGTLAGGIAHDFNNLLTVMTGYAHLVKDQLPADSPLRSDVDEIDRAASRAASLTRQLLTFSRQRVTRRIPLDLNDSLRSMEKMLRRLLGVNIQLTTQLEASLPRIVADPAQIDQVIMNLAVNSRDAMPNGGKLEFRTHRADLGKRDVALGLPPGSYVLLTVADTGIGMDEATQQRVFEPFYTTKDVGKGTGLGLSTVYGIIQDCGGHISLSSELGRGAVFTIYLPASQAKAQDEAQARKLAARGSETILLVEDDAAICSLAAKILESSGYRVLTAADAPQARRVLDDTRTAIDVMVSDVMIPGGSGPELGRHAEVVRPTMKCFYISGHAAGKVPPGAILLQKPFSPIELAVQIRAILDREPSGASEAKS